MVDNGWEMLISAFIHFVVHCRFRNKKSNHSVWTRWRRNLSVRNYWREILFESDTLKVGTEHGGVNKRCSGSAVFSDGFTLGSWRVYHSFTLRMEIFGSTFDDSVFLEAKDRVPVTLTGYSAKRCEAQVSVFCWIMDQVWPQWRLRGVEKTLLAKIEPNFTKEE